MADTKKRFTLGNTTVNLGEIENVGGLIGCVGFNTYPYCANHITVGCYPVTLQNCYHVTVGCRGVTLLRTTDWTERIRTAELTPRLRIEEIAGLKEQIKEDLHAVEAHEEVIRSAEIPQTMEEMNIVEKKLKDSLAEVQKLKKELAVKK